MRSLTYIRRPLNHAGLSALAIVCLGVVLYSYPLYAVDKPDFRINDDIGASPQTTPRIAGQINGSHVVCWLDRRLGRHEIYYQRLSAEGDPLLRNQRLSSDTSSAERFQGALDASLSGTYSTVWKDFRNGSFPFGPDLYRRFLDSAGAPGAVETNTTVTAIDSIFEQPDLALRPDGSGAMVWAEHNGEDWNIMAQGFTGDGAPAGSAVRVNDDVSSTAQQHSPRVCAASSGWYVVTWYDNRNGNDDVFFQVFDESGQPSGPNVRANDDSTTARQAFPSVACDGAGRFTMCWVDWRNGAYPSNPDIYARRFAVDGSPLSDGLRISTDSTGAPQRESAIAADRLGNVVIVWADSAGGDWNIVGQIIDQKGEFVEKNFQINTDTTGKQVQPDVWLDGFDLRAVWTDLRNGDFDIYGRTLNYNQPALELAPDHLDLTMHTTGPAPTAVEVAVLNAGLGQLDFSFIDTVDWLTVSAQGTTAPGKVTLTVNRDTLSAGLRFAQIPFVDETNHDSSVTLNVSLNVTTSIIQPAVDTLHIIAPAQLGAPPPARLAVENAGTGVLRWSVSEATPWLAVSPNSGLEGDTALISVSVSGLPLGEYYGPLVFSDTLAANSPDTVIVHLSYVTDIAFLALQDDTLHVSLQANTSANVGTVVQNLGGGVINWSVHESSPWLSAIRGSGGIADSVTLMADAVGMEPGRQEDKVWVVDRRSANDSVPLFVKAEVTPADSLVFNGVTVGRGELFLLPLSLHSREPLIRIHLPLFIDSSLFELDSAFLSDDPAFAEFGLVSVADSASGDLLLECRLKDQNSGASVPPGIYSTFITLSLVAKDRDFRLPTAEMISADDSITATYKSGLQMAIPIAHAEIISGAVTAVPDDNNPALPNKAELTQNFPNPFNLSTKFILYLPERTNVTVRIFNILGQAVRTLVEGELSAGPVSLEWNGLSDDGRVMPTGIYLYRAESADFAQTRKALLIK